MSENYNINMDGEYHEFEGGAVRYTKTGKGRFDLIPMEIINEILYYPFDEPVDPKTEHTEFHIMDAITNHDAPDVIRSITAVKYGDGIFEVKSIAKMLLDLAIHYEKGAEKYGVDNWKKGIPKESFWDSGCRHTMQYLAGNTDEPHWIAAIWNMVGYLWDEQNFKQE